MDLPIFITRCAVLTLMDPIYRCLVNSSTRNVRKITKWQSEVWSSLKKHLYLCVCVFCNIIIVIKIKKNDEDWRNKIIVTEKLYIYSLFSLFVSAHFFLSFSFSFTSSLKEQHVCDKFVLLLHRGPIGCSNENNACR